MIELSDKMFLSEQQLLRTRLILVMKHRDQALMDIAREIGVTRATMMKFINGTDTTFRVLNKIERYCLNHEGKQ